MPSFLASAVHASPRQILRYVNASPVQIGSDVVVGSNVTGTGDTQRRANWVIQFENELYAYVGTGIAKLQPDGLTWNFTGGLLFAVTTAGTPLAVFSGLHVVTISGVPHMVGLRRSGLASASLYSFKYNSATKVWSEGAALVLPVGVIGGDPAASLQRHVIFKGVMHLVLGQDDDNPTRLMTWDPSTDTAGVVSSPAGWLETAYHNTTAFCVFDDRLFMVYTHSVVASVPVSLAEFIGGIWVAIDSTFDTAPQGNALLPRDGQFTLFTDHTNLYAITVGGPSSGDRGLKCWQWDSALSRTDISTSVIPTAFLETADGGPGTGVTTFAHQIWNVPDIDSTEGTLTTWLFQVSNPTLGASVTLWRWNGNAALITEIDNGGARVHALPGGAAAGGERFFVPPDQDIKIKSRVSVVGGERLTFLAFGDPLVVAHGGVAGGPFEAGETMTSSSGGSATIFKVFAASVQLGGVTGAFNDTDTLTQTTGTNSGATATQSGASTGGAADKTVTIRFDLQGEPPISLCTLTGTVTGGSASRSGNSVISVTADGITEYTVIWDVTTDGLTVSQRFDLVPYIT